MEDTLVASYLTLIVGYLILDEKVGRRRRCTCADIFLKLRKTHLSLSNFSGLRVTHPITSARE